MEVQWRRDVRRRARDVFFVVLGHVYAVYLAHVVAGRIFGSGRAAFLSQIPMVLLMVLYTMASLWILAQPMVT